MKYRLYAQVTGGKYLGEVEADSPDEAKEKGFNLDACNISLCHQCCDQCEDPQVEDINVEAADE